MSSNTCEQSTSIKDDVEPISASTYTFGLGIFVNVNPSTNNYISGYTGNSGISVGCVSNYYKSNGCRIEFYIAKSKEENKKIEIKIKLTPFRGYAE